MLDKLRLFVTSAFNWKGISMRVRAHRCAFVAFFLMTSVVGSIYRAHIWGSGIRDFGLADAWTNIWAVPTSTFWWVGFVGSEQDEARSLVLASATAYILYEFMQMTGFQWMIFDWRDVVGTLFGVPVALAAHWVMDRYLSARRPTASPDSPEL